MQITEHIHAIKIPFQVKTASGVIDRFVYSYLICGDDICLIDSGVSHSSDLIFNYMDNIGYKPNDISLMILSHSHPDHIGSAKSIKEKSGCKIAAHSAEINWIQDVELQAKERPVPNFYFLVEDSVDVDIVLANGDILDLGENISLKVIHSSGHSKGSISLFIPEEGVLFTGDSIPIKGDLPIYDDFIESIESIKKLKAIKGFNTLLASWDDPKEGENAHRIMDEGLEYLKQINESVIKIYRTNPDSDRIKFSKLVLKDLGIPEMAANPIVARSFQSNLIYINDQDL